MQITGSTFLASDVWAVVTRQLTANHVLGAQAVTNLANGAQLTPGAGERSNITAGDFATLVWEVYGGAAWQGLQGTDTCPSMNFYQKVLSGDGALRINNGTGAARYVFFTQEQVGASIPEPMKLELGQILLEQNEGYIITTYKKWVDEHKVELENDKEDLHGYHKYREILKEHGVEVFKPVGPMD